MDDTRSVTLECLRRLATWDADGVGELFADTIDWNVPGPEELPWTGRRTQREQVPEYFRTMWAHFFTERTQIVAGPLLVDGEDAVQLGTFHHVARPEGRAFHTAFALHLTVRGGRIVGLHLYEDTYAVARAFGHA